MAIEITVDASQVHKVFKRINNRLRTKKQFMMTRVKPIVQREILLNLHSQGRPGKGGRKKFEPLSDSRKTQRTLMGIPAAGPILVATGEMAGDLASLKTTFRGDTLKITPSTTDKNKLVKMSALHFGVPKASVSPFGITSGNAGQQTTVTRKSKLGKVYSATYRLPTRPVFFITQQAMKEIVVKGRKYFFGR